MVTIKFQGWFQCRLATDPDPVDEPRGVSGYMQCLPGEPDLDRIIRFHNPVVNRAYGPTIGVFITKVADKNQVYDNHKLIGSAFNLDNDPMFYGYNGIIGDDGFEPIVPLDISITQGNFQVKRSALDQPMQYPFTEGKPTNQILLGGHDIAEATGIWDIASHLEARRKRLEQDLLTVTDEIEKAGIAQRVKFLLSPSPFRYFNARMNWNRPLAGKVTEAHNQYINIPDKTPWTLSFWMGGWDPDALAGYVSGILRMPKCSLIS